MEERKKFAKEIRKMFSKKTTPLFAIALVLTLAFIGVTRINNTAVVLIACLILLVGLFAIIRIADLYVFAEKLMYCRALVGKEISNDPVAEGCDRARKYRKNLRSYRRKCERIMYNIGRTAMSVGNFMEQIPGLDKFAGIYKNLVKRLLENSSHIIVTYQIGCYEEADQDQFYDLVTYFVQDGKNFLTKTMKSEAKQLVIGKISTALMCIMFLAFAFTKNILFAIIGVVVLILGIVIAVGDDDFDILCDYIAYVQSHELNTDLREKIVIGIDAGNTALDLRNLYYNPTDRTMRRAMNSVEELAEKYSD